MSDLFDENYQATAYSDEEQFDPEDDLEMTMSYNLRVLLLPISTRRRPELPPGFGIHSAIITPLNLDLSENVGWVSTYRRGKREWFEVNVDDNRQYVGVEARVPEMFVFVDLKALLLDNHELVISRHGADDIPDHLMASLYGVRTAMRGDKVVIQHDPYPFLNEGYRYKSKPLPDFI
jgi:hypothetical protein